MPLQHQAAWRIVGVEIDPGEGARRSPPPWSRWRSKKCWCTPARSERWPPPAAAVPRAPTLWSRALRRRRQSRAPPAPAVDRPRQHRAGCAALAGAQCARATGRRPAWWRIPDRSPHGSAGAAQHCLRTGTSKRTRSPSARVQRRQRGHLGERRVELFGRQRRCVRVKLGKEAARRWRRDRPHARAAGRGAAAARSRQPGWLRRVRDRPPRRSARPIARSAPATAPAGRQWIPRPSAAPPMRP